MPNSLQGLTVLITRPFHQAQSLCQSIERLGGKTILFPTIAIADAPNPKGVLQLVKTLDKDDLAIFISPNAVQKALPFIQLCWSNWPTTVKIAAVGASTAQCLREHDLPVDFFPTSQFNSEALLTLSALQNVSNKRIVIFCGLGGRDLLAATLRARGAHVEEVIVYQRVLPVMSTEFIVKPELIDIIVCTSNTGLHNLMELLGAKSRAELQNVPLLVVSERAAILAKELGFLKKSRLAENATDAAIIDALIVYRKEKIHAAD